MSYISKQSAKNSEPDQKMTNTTVVPAFSDQRSSTAAQLKQQQIMHLAHPTAAVQQLQAKNEEPLQGEFESEKSTQLQVASSHSGPQVISRKTILQAGGAGIVEGGATAIPSATGPTSGKQYTAALGAKTTRFTAVEAIRNKYSGLGRLGDDAEFINLTRVKTLARTKNSHDASINKMRQLLGEEKSNKGEAVHADMNGLLNQAEISLVDPFKLTATAVYDTDKNLSVDVFYSDDNKGYIVKVTDSGKGVDANLALSPEGTLMGRRHYGHETDNSGEKDQVGVSGSYSSMHHSGGSTALMDNIGAIDGARTYEKNEQGVDAYTKLIAEGGRWQSVAALGDRLRDNSKFFVRDDQNTWELNFVSMVPVNYVTFESLWGIWKKFKTKFEVSDETLKEYVLDKSNKGVVEDNWQADDNGETQDYNLGDEAD